MVIYKSIMKKVGGKIMSRSVSRKGYKEIEFPEMDFLNSGKLVNLNGGQNTVEVNLGNLGFEIELNEER